MKPFTAMLRAGVKILRRDRTLLITSLGIALISIFVFGWLFGGKGSEKLALGVVDQDGSPITAQLVAQLRQNDSLVVSTGTEAAELADIRNGNRNAVLVFPTGFATDLAGGHATIGVYYAKTNPVSLAITHSAVQNVVANINAAAKGQPNVVSLSEQSVSVHILRQIDWLTPGMLGMLLMWANLSIGTLLVQWRQTGILKRLAVTPLRPGALMASQMLARLVLSLAQGAVLVAVAMLVFHVQIVGSVVALVGLVALGALTMMSLGFVAGSLARTPEAAQSVMFLVSFPMMFLGGSYFPTDNSPAFLTPVIKAMPLSYLNDALRQIINNGATFAGVQHDALILVVWMVAALLFSTRAFRWA